jgi:hypothetical protein
LLNLRLIEKITEIPGSLKVSDFMRRKKREVQFDLLGVPDGQQTFLDLELAYADNKRSGKYPQISGKKD